MSRFIRSLGLALVVTFFLAAPALSAPAGKPGGSEPPPGLGVQANKNKNVSNSQLGARGQGVQDKTRTGAAGQSSSGAKTRTRNELTHRVGQQR